MAKSVTELREKYWSDKYEPFPALRSPEKLEVRFNWQEFGLNREILAVAQRIAMEAVMLQDEKRWNMANYHLTGAYEDARFYSQF